MLSRRKEQSEKMKPHTNAGISPGSARAHRTSTGNLVGYDGDKESRAEKQSRLKKNGEGGRAGIVDERGDHTILLKGIFELYAYHTPHPTGSTGTGRMQDSTGNEYMKDVLQW